MGQRLTFLYDREADVLYVSLRRPDYTDYIEVNDDLILRLDPETKEVVGFTIIDFVANFSRLRPRFHVPLEATFKPSEEIKELIKA